MAIEWKQKTFHCPHTQTRTLSIDNLTHHFGIQFSGIEIRL